MTIDLSSLNESQRTAVNWADGPILVLAGPGSGKTRVLTYRIAALIDATPEARFGVLGITFTNKAATEMRSRIDALLRRGRDRAVLTTFHAFSAELLRQHGSHVGLRPDFTILSERGDSEALLAEAIKATLGAGYSLAPRVSQFMPIVTRMLDECIPAAGAENWLSRHADSSEAAAVYAEYRSLSLSTGQLDFASLLALAVELLETKPLIAAQSRSIYPHVCVDEFQDTNAAQYRMLVQLVRPNAPDLFVVADDDQLIYEWNGASAARIDDIQQRYQMAVVQLPENYRCPADVVQIANELIQHNSGRSGDKRPATAHKSASNVRAVTVLRFDDFSRECSWLAQTFADVPLSERSGYVVLTRRKKLLEGIVTTLTASGVPAYVASRKNEFESAPYRFLHSMLRLANSRTAMEQLRRVSRTFYQLEGLNIDVQDVAARSALAGEDLLRAWLADALGREALETGTRKMLGAAQSSLLERLLYWPFVQAAREWFASVENRPQTPGERAFDEYADEVEIWDSLVAQISAHFNLDELSLNQFLQELDLRAKEPPPPPNAIRCLTIHGAKGAEFRHVFLAGLVEEELPSWAAVKKGDASHEMQEERRSCFVAITRAEETLSLTYSGNYYGYPKRPSRFLAEMGVAAR